VGILYHHPHQSSYIYIIWITLESSCIGTPTAQVHDFSDGLLLGAPLNMIGNSSRRASGELVGLIIRSDIVLHMLLHWPYYEIPPAYPLVFQGLHGCYARRHNPCSASWTHFPIDDLPRSIWVRSILTVKKKLKRELVILMVLGKAMGVFLIYIYIYIYIYIIYRWVDLFETVNFVSNELREIKTTGSCTNCLGKVAPHGIWNFGSKTMCLAVNCFGLLWRTWTLESVSNFLYAFSFLFFSFLFVFNCPSFLLLILNIKLLIIVKDSL
jgi:hypothetical protein